ncbi:lipase family protein [uncultured Jatrophihabitans sp.]|uniref:lipase family protein n=1 Tax=uncultured Jatrophihabitans sp. TaxID=1610747 RepID=UPI0035CA8D39
MRKRGIGGLLCAVAVFIVGQPGAGAADKPKPNVDSFYTSPSAAKLAHLKPGSVIRTRPITYHETSGVPATYNGVQLLYRTTTELGKPTVTVTSLIEPHTTTHQLVSDQWFYDALQPGCDPSYWLNNGGSSDGGTNQDEGPLVGTFLAAGQAVVISDYEGEDLAWTSAQQEGWQTLDGIRAALNYTTSNTDPLTGTVALPSDTKVGLIGYSGGAIAGEWAAELAHSYAPDVSKRIVGTALGGVYVYPYHNLQYISGSPKWSGVIPGGLLGTARGFGIDSDKYASAYGRKLADDASKVCIDQLLSKHPGLKYSQLVKPQYADFAKVPEFVRANNKSIMSTGGTPTAPMYIAQGVDPDPTGPQGEMTPPSPKYGPGDGVMLMRDTEALAYTYCHRGVPVQYQVFNSGHTNTFLSYFPTGAIGFLNDRFAAVTVPTPATSSCSTLTPGNSLKPLPVPPSDPSSASSHRSSSGSGNRVSNGSTPAAKSATDAIASTGTPTGQLLLWATLLLGIGVGLLWVARRPAAAAVAIVVPQRLRPRPTARPLPYPREHRRT